MSEKTQPKTEFAFHKFNIETIARDATCVILGQRGSGKSVLIRNILQVLKDIPQGIIISKTEKYNKAYSDIFPSTFIYDKYSRELVEKVFSSQESKLNHYRREHPEVRDGKSVDNSFLMVMEDCLADASLWKKDTYIKEIFQNGRHANICYIVTLQYTKGITPELRSNIDYIFIFRHDSKVELRSLYENYASIIPTFSIFCQILESLTRNYMCMVIENKNKGNKEWWERIYYCKAKSKLEPFKFGSDAFWEFHDNYYKGTQCDSDQDDDIRKGIDLISKYASVSQPIKLVIKQNH